MYRFTPLKEEEPPRWHLRANPGAICSSHILNLCPKRCPGSFFSSSWRSPPEPTPICAPTLRPSPARHRLAMKKATRHWRAAPCLAESRCIPEHHLAERCTARLWHVLDEQVLTTCQRPRRVVTAQDLGTRVSQSSTRHPPNVTGLLCVAGCSIRKVQHDTLQTHFALHQRRFHNIHTVHTCPTSPRCEETADVAAARYEPRRAQLPSQR